jgi:drug/metabolite transporter (DMT)-like permease
MKLSNLSIRDFAVRLLVPLLFVFLWSTGFIGAKSGLPYAEPFTFLFVRMTIAAALLFVIALVLQEPWPESPTDYGHVAVVGVLMHGVYLGGVFYAISIGVNAGVSALIVSLQPLITVLLAARYLSETVSAVTLSGIALGLLGVLIVVFDKGLNFDHIPPAGLLACVLSLLAISIGTVYQKRFCSHIALLPGVCIQFTANTIFLLLLAYQLETMHIVWSPEFLFALGWLVLVLSLGAVLLLMWLIRQGNAGQVASLFYLVPPFAAIEAWWLFNETLSTAALFGMGLCVVGVALVVRNPDR